METQKYRAWMKGCSVMFEVLSIDFQHRSAVLMCETYLTNGRFDEIEFMQSTGVEDLSKREIFDRDIVYNKTFEEYGLVYFDQGAYWVRYENDEDGIFTDHLHEYYDEIAIVGNVFQNKDLAGKFE